jgi:hypothetical protein
VVFHADDVVRLWLIDRMAAFIVERYLAGWSPAEVAALVARIEHESIRFTSCNVTHLNTITIPSDETCLCLFEADTLEAVVSANAALDLPADRVVPVNVAHDSSADRS